MWARAAGLTCAAVALAVCAWFALGARQAIDTQRASAIVSGQNAISAAQAHRALELLHSARTLNPDRQVDVLRAVALIESHHRRRARRILVAVTRDEPLNLAAWAQLARASGNDRSMFARAVNHLRQLEPFLPLSR